MLSAEPEGGTRWCFWLFFAIVLVILLFLVMCAFIQTLFRRVTKLEQELPIRYVDYDFFAKYVNQTQSADSPDAVDPASAS